MNNINDDIAAAEAEWTAPAKLPDAAQEESYELTRTAKVDAAFKERVLPLESIKLRRTQLGLDGELTREKLESVKSLNGLCRKANGDIDRVSDWIKEDALKLQKLVNTRKNEFKAQVAKIQQPMLAFITKCKEEDEAAERAKVEAELQAKREAEEAERKAAQAVEDAKREAERKQFQADRASLEAKLAAELADRQKVQAELSAFKQAKAAEEAEQRRIALEAADKFNREQAAEKERLRLEAIEPDVPKLRRFAAAIKLTSDKAPKLTSAEAVELSTWACEHLTRISAALLDFGTPKQP